MKNTQRNHWLMAGVAVALMVAGCATSTGPQYEVVMDPDAPVTEAPPVYAVGSSWTYDHTVNGETVRATSTIVEKREIDGREVDVHAVSQPNREPGSTCEGANGNLTQVAPYRVPASLK